MMNKLIEFKSREELDLNLAKNVAEQLQQAIDTKGKASIAFSGGSTPKGFFKALSTIDIDWQHVTLTLADDRWLDESHENSNAKLIRENLMVNRAASASFFSLTQQAELTSEYLSTLTETAQKDILPLDVVILGMGEDGHTASIFPCSAQVAEGLDKVAQPKLMKTVPTTAPYDRITFNFPALINSTNLYLHIVGDSKLEVLNSALADDNAFEMPIRAFLQHPEKQCKVYWAQ